MLYTRNATMNLELEQAYQRTGPTPQLDRAARVLPELLSLPPESVEELFFAVGQMEGNGSGDIEEYDISC